VSKEKVEIYGYIGRTETEYINWERGSTYTDTTRAVLIKMRFILKEAVGA